MVRDPNFWRRFSIAVHQDNATKEEITKRPEMKHSYVQPLSSPARAHFHSTSASPTSQSNLSPALSPIELIHTVFFAAPQPVALHTTDPEKDEEKERKQPVEKTRSRYSTSKPTRRPSKLRKSPSTRSTHPLLHPPSSFVPHTNRRPSFPSLGLRCPSSLSLSGRSRNQFRTWTTITGGANNTNRDSWLESQKKKSRQRTWICWCFWLCITSLVTGVVIAIVVMRAHSII